MAHAGKHYPLAFRRDLAVNVFTYREGLPAVWHVLFGSMSGTVGDVVERYAWQCREVPDVNAYPVHWRSTARVEGGHSVTAGISAAFDTDRRRTVLRIHIFDGSVECFRQPLGTNRGAEYYAYRADDNDTVELDTPQCHLPEGGFNTPIACWALDWINFIYVGIPDRPTDPPIRPGGIIPAPPAP